MNRKEIENHLREMIVKRVEENITPETIEMDTELTLLGLDSLGFSWLLADIEDTFDFIVDGAAVIKLKTLGSIIDYVENHVSD
ncbi:acyl carrier protein [Clostridiaceae bacterium UIB06]|uniref:Acyl carrier protein n=1 Tax=Clostridium thailandense TaxID=2794346 RepID=A0A949TWX0_9CLOT|nr:acyl carrier protein [Clostridium thailandense]MBV7272443.1 acyl carrier protein [Clostridium thailandense]MCH5136967.1 acyl carrier protein [Clostridiaceae bacterium UIB06]